ncbi:hypothetical protein ACLBXM_14590 [Xanthobacteraceae bacterium A53D]
MLITTFGAPSSYTQCCIYLMRLLTAKLLREVDYIAVSERTQLKEAWENRSRSHVFFFSDFPERALVNVFLNIDAPSIVFLEDPDVITDYIMRERKVTWPWAVRLTNQCMITIGDIIASENALVLRREYELTLREFFNAIIQHYEIKAKEEQLASIVRKITKGKGKEIYTLDTPLETVLLERWPKTRTREQSLKALARTDLGTVHQMNDALKPILAGRRLEQMAWPQEMFIAGDRPNDTLIGVIEMLGPARCLSYGPYLHLPAGEWTLLLDLGVRENFSGNSVDIDILQGEVITMDRFALPAEGDFQLRATFEVVEPRLPIQVRVLMREGAIEGMLEIRSATVTAARQPSLKPLYG